MIDNIFTIDRSIDYREFFQCFNRSLAKKGHKTQLYPMYFFKFILVTFAQIYHRLHIDLIKGGQDGILMLCR